MTVGDGMPEAAKDEKGLNPDRILALPQLVAAEAEAVLASTVRMHPALREALYLLRVRPLLDKLSMAERQALDTEYAASYGIGWNIMSQLLGVLSGHDTSVRIGGRQPNMVYTPRYNYGGWVRIWRSKAAMLPTSPAYIERMVREELGGASRGEAWEERVRGRWGITPNVPLTGEAIRKAILGSDLYSAPWMVAVWRPSHGWVVAGSAMRYLDGATTPDDPAIFDLLSRSYADQTFPPKVDEDLGVSALEMGQPWLVPARNAGPTVGLDNVFPWVELGLRRGWRVDFVWEPAERPLDSWEDGLPGVAETPLQGYLIHTPAASFLVAIRYENGEAKLEGVNEEDYELFESFTGVHPDRRLTNGDLEVLATKGTPIFGRIPSFVMKVERKNQ